MGPHTRCLHRHSEGRDIAAKFGNQPERVIRQAQNPQVGEYSSEQKQQHIESALIYAREKNLERQSVVDERDLMRDSLRRWCFCCISSWVIEKRFSSRV